MADRTVAVLAGGLSHEREVSLRSGRRLSAVLRDQGFHVEEWDADAELIDRLRDRRPDAVIIALHGGAGEDGSIPAILEMLRVPFVGTGSHGCRWAWDKPTAKAIVAAAGFRTPDWISLPHSTFRELGARDVLDAMVDRLGLPLILKPDQGGSALGAQVVRDRAELPTAMVGCFAYGDTVLAERFITGTEVAVTVLEQDGELKALKASKALKALPAVEIVPENGVYDYTARYTAGLTDFFTPARLPNETTEALGELATSVHQRLGLRDISRTDAIVGPDGDIQFLEVNVSPGLTETSMVPMAIEAAGESVGKVFTALIDQAIARAH